MGLSRPPLPTLRDRIRNDYFSRLLPLQNTPRYNLLDIISQVDAGIYHQLYGDQVYLSRQLFPDTADSDFLRAHWSDRVPPLHATSAVGPVTFTGPDGAAIPAGLLLESSAGQTYYTKEQATISAGSVSTFVTASAAGVAGNLSAGSELSIISSIPPGVSDVATVAEPGIDGGVNGETDVEYLTRVLLWLQTGQRYGKPGDGAAWAIDASAEVDKAWEYKNYSVFGVLLIQVVGGNQADGIVPVVDLALVAEYINTVAPPGPFTVMTPDLVAIDPSIELLPAEDTVDNRNTVLSRIHNWMDIAIKPGSTVTSGQIRDAFVDGVVVTDATVTLPGNDPLESTLLQLLTLGGVTWVT